MSESPSPLTPEAVRRSRALIYVLINALGVAVIAVFHRESPPIELKSVFSLRTLVCAVVLESLLLFTPAMFAAVATRGRWRLRSTVVVTSALVALWVIDLLLIFRIREHLLSRTFGGLFWKVAAFLPAYITVAQWAAAGTGMAAFVAAQWLLWRVSGWLDRWFRASSDRGSVSAGWLAGLMLVMIAGFAAPALIYHRTTKGEMVISPARHPLTASGWFPANRVPSADPKSEVSLRGRAWMLDHAADYRRRVSRLCSITGRGRRSRADRGTAPGTMDTRPDIVLVIVECWRSDVVGRGLTPYTDALGDRGIICERHFSTGNASCYGFHGLLFGIESDLYHVRQSMPANLCEAVRGVGYEVGFFARGDAFDQFGMGEFCNPDRYDVFEVFDGDGTAAPDFAARDAAIKFLTMPSGPDRVGRPPRLAVVYVYAPHQGYREAVDEAAVLALPPDVRESRRAGSRTFAEYLASVHLADRIVGDLTSPDRITVVTGDHGESFGEDGRQMHGTALSAVQLRVGCVMAGPGLPRREVSFATSHIDVATTLLRTAGVSPSVTDALPGVDLSTAGGDRSRVFLCRSLSSPNRLFVTATVPDAADTALGYQGFFDWPTHTLSPGAPTDRSGESVRAEGGGDSDGTDGWESASPMRRWISDRLRIAEFEIAEEVTEPLARACDDPERTVRMAAVDTLEMLPPTADRVSAVRSRLSDPDDEVRRAAMRALLTLQRRSP